MARVLGRHAGLLTFGLLSLVVIGPLAVFAPAWAAATVAAAGLAGAGFAQVRFAGLRTRCDKLSQEVDVLSRRLLQAEKAGPPSEDAARQGALRAEVEELTVEIGLLSGIVRDLSAVVRSQDGEIARLKEAASAVREPAAAPEPRGEAVAPASRATPRLEVQLEAPALEAHVLPPVASPVPLPEPDPPARPRPIPPRAPAHPASPDEAAVVSAFETGGLEVYLQPVVTLPQRKVVGYEALARLRVAERALEPRDFLPALERHGRTTELDRRMLARTGTIVRHLGRRGSDARVTYGLSPLSLFEPGFLKEIARLAGDDQALATLDIALPQASWRGLDAGQRGLLTALRGRIGFCLDRPIDLRFDTRELVGYGVGQVKVPADLLTRPAAARAALTDIAVEDLAPALARAGLRFVVNEVTSEADVPDLIDLNVPYAQGAAFAPPRPVRAEILTDPAPETPAPPEAPLDPERRPFRSFLRRAV